MENEELELFQASLERVLQDAPLEDIDRAGGLSEDADVLWRTLDHNGFIRLCASEALGGLGLPLADALPLVVLSGRFALAAPFGDSVLAHAILSEVGFAVPEGRVGIALCGRKVLPHATQCAFALALNGPNEALKLSLCAVSREMVEPFPKMEDGIGAFDPASSEVIFETTAPDWLTVERFTALGAVVRSAQMTGAMKAVLDITLSHTAEREQFGRPLTKFQAIQHHLSNIACEAAAAAAALELAGDALRDDPKLAGPALRDIGIAKLRCGQAASVVAAAAHQAHGALGFTREYALGSYTRRLWQWQDEFGSETKWALSLGREVAANPEGGLWGRVST